MDFNEKEIGDIFKDVRKVIERLIEHLLSPEEQLREKEELTKNLEGL